MYIIVLFMNSRSTSFDIAFLTLMSSNGQRRMFIAKPWKPTGSWLKTRLLTTQLCEKRRPNVSVAMMRAE